MTLSLGHCTIDLDAGRVEWPDRTESLTPTESKLLAYLIDRAGQVVPRRDLLEDVWGYHPESRTHTVGVVMRKVRRKIERIPGRPMMLRTVRGVGFTLQLPRGATAADTNLRAARDAFFGRDAELAVLGAHRLVCVVGAPGMGKTRLATEHAWRAVEAGTFDEVRWVSLVGIEQVADLIARTADACGLTNIGGDRARLLRALRGRGRLLLILDEAEGCHTLVRDLLDDWLDQLPEARFVVTSRRRMGAPGERVMDLGPLPVAEGAALFADRAQARGGAVTADAPGVPELVDRLQGTPLALELAAARTGLYTTRELLSRLDEGTDHALAAALDWTISLLEPWERTALAQTAVFAGGFTVDAAQDVLQPGGDRDGRAALRALRDWSLVRRLPDDDVARFDSFTFIRDRARAMLAETDQDAATVRRRHAAHYARTGTDEWLRSLTRDGALQRRRLMERERANLKLGIVHGDDTSAARCALALSAVVYVYGPFGDGLDAVRRVLSRPGLDEAVRYRLEVAGAQDCHRLARAAEGLALLDAAASRTPPSAFWAFRHASVRYALTRRTPVGVDVYERLAERANALAEALGDPGQLSVARTALGNVAWDRGDYTRAAERQREALAFAESAGDQRGAYFAKGALGSALNRAGDARGRALLEEAFTEAEAAGDAHTAAYLGVNRVSHLVTLGRLEEAVELGDRVVTLVSRAGLVDLEAAVWANLGRALLGLDAVDDAVEAFEAGVSRGREARWAAVEGVCAAHLAYARSLRGDPGQLAAARRAVDRVREDARPVHLHGPLVRLAQVAEREGQLDLARQCLQEQATLVDPPQGDPEFSEELRAIRARIGLA